MTFSEMERQTDMRTVGWRGWQSGKKGEIRKQRNAESRRERQRHGVTEKPRVRENETKS